MGIKSKIEALYFKGRLSRKDYLKMFLVWHFFAVPYFCYFIYQISIGDRGSLQEFPAFWGLFGVFLAFTLLFWERMNALRFQDMGRSRRELWLIFPEVPLSFRYHFLDLFFREGDDDTNEYGKRP